MTREKFKETQGTITRACVLVVEAIFGTAFCMAMAGEMFRLVVTFWRIGR